MSLSDQWRDWLVSLRDSPESPGLAGIVEQGLALCVDVAPGTVGCSLTEMHGATYRTPQASSSMVRELDAAQYAAHVGPCVSAARDQQVQRLDVIADEHRFRAFARACAERDVRSSLSMPVVGTLRPAALNFYATEPFAYASPLAVARAKFLSRCLEAVLPPAPTKTAPARTVRADEIRRAEQEGQAVQQAVGAVMRRQEITRSDAYAVLVERSRTGHSSIREIVLDELHLGGWENEHDSGH